MPWNTNGNTFFTTLLSLHLSKTKFQFGRFTKDPSIVEMAKRLMNGGQVDESEIRGGSGRRPKRKSDDEVSEAASKMLKIDERNCWCHHKRDTICLLGFHSYVFYLQNASKPSRDISELVLICIGNSRMFFFATKMHTFFTLLQFVLY